MKNLNAINKVEKPLIPVDMKKSTDIPLKMREYEQISHLIYQKSGIFLGPHKITMVQSRLIKRLKKLGLKTYKDYIKYLKKNIDGQEAVLFTNALTTNKTEFFRETGHFDFFKNNFLGQTDRSNHFSSPLYVWSAACSTGEEAYTLAMIMEEHIKKNPQFFYRILGTDIDTHMVSRADRGVYKKHSLANIPPPYVQRYFMRGIGSNKNFFKVRKNLKQNIKFRQFNLVEESRHLNIKFNIIFLRNVLIYFNKETVEKVIAKVSSLLTKGGVLFIGHSETLYNVKHDLKSMGTSIYYKE